MPCYLFTYHGYGTWMPDHCRGYVRRGEGVLATDTHMAVCYDRNLRQNLVYFDAKVQQSLIDTTRSACEFLKGRCHAVASERSHVHVLLSWNSNRTWQGVSRAIKTALTRRLNEGTERQKWFSKGGSRKQVKDREHFEYLLEVYLPRHRGLFWREPS